MQSTTIRPGLLISLRTTVAGNVSYAKETIKEETRTEDGAMESEWNTRKTVEDASEFEAASKVRGRCRTLIVALCAKSQFGLLCPEDKQDKLDAAVAEARRIADEFNATSRLTSVNVYIIAGKVARDDEEAARAIRAEVRQTIDEMERSIRMLDVTAIREAAKKARDLGKVLSPDAQQRVQSAIDAARKFATKANKSAVEAEGEVDALVREMMQARTMFIDLEGDDSEVEAPEHVAPALALMPAVATEKPVCPNCEGAGCSSCLEDDGTGGYGDDDPVVYIEDEVVAETPTAPPTIDMDDGEDEDDYVIPTRTPQAIELD